LGEVVNWLSTLLLTVFCLWAFTAFAVAQETAEQRPMRPWETTCRNPLPQAGDFSPQERWAWEERLCVGDVADLSAFPLAEDGKGCDPGNSDDWPQHRKLSEKFLHTILFHEPWKSTPRWPRIVIRCAWFGHSISLADQWLRPALSIDNSRFDGRIDLKDLRTDGLLSFQGSHFREMIDADRLKVSTDLLLRGGAKFCQRVNLLGAEIGGNLSATGSTFKGLFNADGLKVGGSLFLRNGAKFKNVDLIIAEIEGGLQLWGSEFAGHLDLTGAHITQDLLLATSDHRPPDWQAGARLTVRNARVGALQATGDAWTIAGSNEPLPTDLSGFSYNRLAGFRAGEGDSMANLQVAELIEWLRSHRRPDKDHDAHYTPQPYDSSPKSCAMAANRQRPTPCYRPSANISSVPTTRHCSLSSACGG
jgi:hypothetical protein